MFLDSTCINYFVSNYWLVRTGRSDDIHLADSLQRTCNHSKQEMAEPANANKRREIKAYKRGVEWNSGGQTVRLGTGLRIKIVVYPFLGHDPQNQRVAQRRNSPD